MSMPQGARAELVADIVVAVRSELKDLVPTVLARVLEDFNELKKSQATSEDSMLKSNSYWKQTEAPGSENDQEFDVVAKDAATETGTSRIAEADVSHASTLVGSHAHSGESRNKDKLEQEISDPVPGSSSSVSQSQTSLWRVKGGLRGASPREVVRYALLENMDSDDEVCNTNQIMDLDAAKRLPQEIAILEVEYASICERLADVGTLWKRRCQIYEEQKASLLKEIQQKQEELAEAKQIVAPTQPPPGPDFMNFVESGWFTRVCIVAVLLNLVAMALQPYYRDYPEVFAIFDNLFLAWYVLELGMKASYYQKSLLIGSVSSVWWHWLDLGIVVGGILDQWLMPLLRASSGPIHFDMHSVGALRFLRVFRILRGLRIIKAFVRSDFAWAMGPSFEFFMYGVIGFNSLVMALELDVPWAGWQYVEHVLLTLYTFELAIRFKKQGWLFFYDWRNTFWNYLDFTIVVGGAVDMWLMPLVCTLKGMLEGHHVQHHTQSAVSGALRLLKIMRILRVLRLVRLLKVVRPLYTLLLGIAESVKEMMWVLVFTFLSLYACSIVFTHIVGRGLIRNGHVLAEEKEYFGTVTESLFSLFKLMNGDLGVVEPITDSVIGKLLFVAFTVMSNWTILAILTAVVSDNMISTSHKNAIEEDERQHEVDHEERVRRMTILFHEMDPDKKGIIDARVWHKMLTDKVFHQELCDASGLEDDVLNDYFECLAEDDYQPVHISPDDRKLDYHRFIDVLQHEGRAADLRSVLRVMSHVHGFESRLAKTMSTKSRGYGDAVSDWPKATLSKMASSMDKISSTRASVDKISSGVQHSIKTGSRIRFPHIPASVKPYKV